MNHVQSTSSLKIGVTCYPAVGGSGILGTHLGLEFAKNGHEIHFITLERPYAMQGVDYDIVKVHRVSVVEYPLFKYPPYTIALATEMSEITEKKNLDLLHVHYSLPHSTAAQLSRMITGKPYITTLHGSDVTILGVDPSYEKINTMSIEESNAITAVSQFMADEAKNRLGIEKKIHVIPNFVDHNKYQPAPCELIEAKDEKGITLIHVSNFRPVKRVGDLVRSMSYIIKKVPHARLILVGDGPDRHMVERLIDKLDLRQNIHATGYRNDISDILRCADTLVMASETESASLTILEAMSTGLSVIATDVGGIPEQVEDGVNGFLVPVKTPSAIAEAAIKLNEDMELRAKMGAKSREKVLEKYTVEKVLAKYQKVYESVTQG